MMPLPSRTIVQSVEWSSQTRLIHYMQRGVVKSFSWLGVRWDCFPGQDRDPVIQDLEAFLQVSIGGIVDLASLTFMSYVLFVVDVRWATPVPETRRTADLQLDCGLRRQCASFRSSFKPTETIYDGQ